MDFLEKDLEDILYNSSPEEIQNRGLRVFNFDSIFRQVRLGNYGIADIITCKKSARGRYFIYVYELKNKMLNADTFWQTVRYVKGVKHHWRLAGLSADIFVAGVMIGRCIDKVGEFPYLPTIASDVIMYTYDYHIDGMKFKHVQDGYVLTNPGKMEPININCESIYDFLRTLVGR